MRVFLLQDLYQFVAKDVAPPFILTTHTQTPLPLSEDAIHEPASQYKNHLLHVIVNEGDREVALQVLSDDAQHSDVGAYHSDTDYVHRDERIYINEGISACTSSLGEVCINWGCTFGNIHCCAVFPALLCGVPSPSSPTELVTME